MKLIIAIVQDKDSHLLRDEFANANVRATRLSTTGGFLRAGNTTFLVGIEEERVEEVLTIIRENCESREQLTTPPVHLDTTLEAGMSMPVPIRVGGATVFVVPVEAFHRF